MPQVKKPGRTRSLKATIDNIEFDSQTEALYYKHLLRDKSVGRIELQPKYTIIDPYEVECKKCQGRGRMLNQRTKRHNNCKLCVGKGKRMKPGAIYTADFRVTYLDGYIEIIDIKGGPVERDFSLRKKLMEQQTGLELIVIRHINKEWVRE
jgi:hypothetical protein